MEKECEESASIESRHRKERKELQAKIQGLKKTAKNDKTKKKELSNEIARLETELEMKHKEELAEYQERSKSEAGGEECNHEQQAEDSIPDQPKLSKAQKRRDKKSQKDKEREIEIKLQEKENLYGPRNIEMNAITEKLRNMKLKIFPIASDGDCLYKAVSHQLELIKQLEFSALTLRSRASAYIRTHKDDFIPFMSHPETFDMLTDEEFEEYCDKIKDTKVWGGQLEIRALSNSLECPINVIQATGPDSIDQGCEFGGPPLIITYHRHMYSLGEHYNSTTIMDEAFLA